ncbi:hypothetical protein CHARACLAT_023324 [Characodon lateralis]|uniref:Uncharacterized protein n=1 Tax=Characodon lateralis TaxID=208331 RepID=A0ABU7ENC2_9TELE|nr:hypothetical protein [Characodon lateralis]
MEGPPVTAYSRLFSPAWVQSGPEIPQEELMRLHVRNFAEYLRVFPEELDFVHLILEAEFLERGWLNAPLPLSAGGLFTPLLEAFRVFRATAGHCRVFKVFRAFRATAGRHRVFWVFRATVGRHRVFWVF